MNLDPCPSPGLNIKSKWIEDLDTKIEILNSVEDKTGKTLKNLDIGKNFFNRIQLQKSIVPAISK